MDKESTKRAAELGRVFGPLAQRGDFADGLCGLQAVARTLHRISERQCNGHQKPNGDWDEAAAKLDEAREATAETKARKLVAAHFGEAVSVAFNGDPRGPAIRLHLAADPSKGDGWGEGYAVY